MRKIDTIKKGDVNTGRVIDLRPVKQEDKNKEKINQYVNGVLSLLKNKKVLFAIIPIFLCIIIFWALTFSDSVKNRKVNNNDQKILSEFSASLEKLRTELDKSRKDFTRITKSQRSKIEERIKERVNIVKSTTNDNEIKNIDEKTENEKIKLMVDDILKKQNESNDPSLMDISNIDIEKYLKEKENLIIDEAYGYANDSEEFVDYGYSGGENFNKETPKDILIRLLENKNK